MLKPMAHTLNKVTIYTHSVVSCIFIWTHFVINIHDECLKPVNKEVQFFKNFKISIFKNNIHHFITLVINIYDFQKVLLDKLDA